MPGSPPLRLFRGVRSDKLSQSQDTSLSRGRPPGPVSREEYTGITTGNSRKCLSSLYTLRGMGAPLSMVGIRWLPPRYTPCLNGCQLPSPECLCQVETRSNRSSHAVVGYFHRTSNRPHHRCLPRHLRRIVPRQRVRLTPSSAGPTGLMLRYFTRHGVAPEQRLLRPSVTPTPTGWSTS
jgi:hypothetical protein